MRGVKCFDLSHHDSLCRRVLWFELKGMVRRTNVGFNGHGGVLGVDQFLFLFGGSGRSLDVLCNGVDFISTQRWA